MKQNSPKGSPNDQHQHTSDKNAINEKNRKNNEAAFRSGDQRGANEKETQIRCEFMERENFTLLTELATLEATQEAT